VSAASGDVEEALEDLEVGQQAVAEERVEEVVVVDAEAEAEEAAVEEEVVVEEDAVEVAAKQADIDVKWLRKGECPYE